MELVQFRAHKGLFFIQLVGSLEFNTSAALETILGWIKNDKAIKRVVVDLSKATLIDSTNLGLIAQLGLYANQKHQYMPILSPGSTPDVKKTLSRLQLHKLFRWKGDEEEFDQFEQNLIRFLGPQKESEHQICERAIAAHHALISLSDSNQAEFRSVIAGLKIEKALLGDGEEPDDMAMREEGFSMNFLDELKVNQPYLGCAATNLQYVH